MASAKNNNFLLIITKFCQDTLFSPLPPVYRRYTLQRLGKT